MKTAEQWCMSLGQLMDEADPEGDELDVQAIPMKVICEMIRHVQQDALGVEPKRFTEDGAIIGYVVPRREILKLAMNDPILDRCLTIWRYGDITFNESMALAAFELSKANRDLEGRLQACRDNQSPSDQALSSLIPTK